MNNTKMGEDIVVGKYPRAIATNILLGTAYVANYLDNTVSVIDAVVDKVVAKTIFNIEPFQGGRIECGNDKLIVPIEQQFYLYAGSECVAKPNTGYEFISWQENLGNNSTQMLQVSPPLSAMETVFNFLRPNHDKPEAILNITKFGSFTANFNELPPAIPPEYIATLFAVVISAFIGSWLTPTLVDWRKTRNQGKKLIYYHNEIKSINSDNRFDKSDIEDLDYLREKITDNYTRGKITKDQYDKLLDEFSVKYREVFNNEINFLGDQFSTNYDSKLIEIKNSLEDTFAQGR